MSLVRHRQLPLGSGDMRGGAATKKKVDQCKDVGYDDKVAHVPIVRVEAVKSIRVLPHHSVAVPVEVTGVDDSSGTWVVEPEELDSFQVEESMLQLCNGENPHIIVVNSTGFTQTLPCGTRVGTAVECSEVIPTSQRDHDLENLVRVNTVMSHDQATWRLQKLQHLLTDNKSNPQRDELHLLLLQYHDVLACLKMTEVRRILCR